jgi:uncharacterized membrane protein YdjX (TVP38/TMEM64 family)
LEKRGVNRNKWLLVLGVLALVGGFFFFDLGRFFSLAYIQGAQADFATLYATRPALLIGGFFFAYVAVAALSLPGAVIMTLLGGAVFGFWMGLLLVSFASSLGATLAMLSARYVLRDGVKARFGARLADIDRVWSAKARCTCSRCAWCPCSPSS